MSLLTGQGMSAGSIYTQSRCFVTQIGTCFDYLLILVTSGLSCGGQFCALMVSYFADFFTRYTFKRAR